VLPPKKRGRPRKENFITPQRNDIDTGVITRSEQMAIGMRKSKRQQKLNFARQQYTRAVPDSALADQQKI